MPFKSKKQKEYLKINEPEVYNDWKARYGTKIVPGKKKAKK
jgi:hypothetical protein